MMKRVFAICLVLVVVLMAFPTNASAASYPLISLSTTESTPTIIEGQVGKHVFTIFPEYKNERYNVEIYNSKNQKVGSVSSTYYNSSSMYRTVTITVDTRELDLTVGTYKIVYWLDFYTFSSWHSAPNKYTGTFKVIKNTCYGNHDFYLDKVWTEPTCEKEGVGRYICDDCGHTVYETLPKAHDYGSWSSSGSYNHTRKCKTCGDTDTASHTFGSGSVTKEPNCAREGTMTYTCTVCSGTKTEPIAKTTDHVFGEWQPDTSTAHKHICTLCQASEQDYHIWGQGTVTKEPNCTVEGIMTYTCSICNGQKNEPIPTTDNHVYGGWSKENDGAHSRSCTLCQKKEQQSHSWNTGTVIREPNCKDQGEKQYSCTVCNGKKSEPIPVTNTHTYGQHVQVDVHTHKQQCTICGNVQTGEHTWDKGVYVVKPTVTSMGLKRYTCSVCAGTKDDVVPMCSLGDVDGNEGVTDADAIYLLYSIFMPELYPVNQDCDFDGDGELTDRDAIYLLYYTFRPEQYPIG